MGLNEFSDLKDEEFRAIKLIRTSYPNVQTEKINLEAALLPKSVDWRQKGIVTPVMNEG